MKLWRYDRFETHSSPAWTTLISPPYVSLAMHATFILKIACSAQYLECMSDKALVTVNVGSNAGGRVDSCGD